MVPQAARLSAVALACFVACTRPPARSPDVDAQWEIHVEGTVDDLAVEGRFEATDRPFIIDDEAKPFLHDVEEHVDGVWRATTAPKCKNGCRVRWRVHLLEAAKRLGNPESGIASGAAVSAPVSMFLFRPDIEDAHGPIRATFALPVATAAKRAGNGYELHIENLEDTTIVALGEIAHHELKIGEATIDVVLLGHEVPLEEAMMVRWAETDARAIVKDLGRFAIDRLMVVALKNNLEGPTRGVTFGGDGAAIVLRVDQKAKASTLLADDWVLTHEMLHVVSPSLPREQIWLSEGIPSYIEPFIRARAGLIDKTKVWRDLWEGLPQGLPEKGDQGLDRTHTWGRTYWGGTLFCLLADVRIREATQGKKSLDDVIRAANAEGANVLAQWSLDRWIQTGDAATGTLVLRQLHTELALAPNTVDIGALFTKLGITVTSTGVSFDDSAPLAAIRRAMTP